jgi:hypothetical protein
LADGGRTVLTIRMTERMEDEHRGRNAALAAVLLAASLGTMGAATMAPGDDESAPLAVLFPVWWGADRAFLATAAAGGAIVREGAISSLLVTQSSEPGFRHRLHAAGAWLLLDPKAVAACLK